MLITLQTSHLGHGCGSASSLAGFLHNPRCPSRLSIALPGQVVPGLARGAARSAGCCAKGMVIFRIKVFSRTADSSEMHTCRGTANAGSGGWITEDPQDRQHERTGGVAATVPGMACRLISLPSRLVPIPGLITPRTLRPYNSPKFLQQAATTADMLKARQLFPRPNCRIRDPEFPSPTHFPV